MNRNAGRVGVGKVLDVELQLGIDCIDRQTTGEDDAVLGEKARLEGEIGRTERGAGAGVYSHAAIVGPVVVLLDLVSKIDACDGRIEIADGTQVGNCPRVTKVIV